MIKIISSNTVGIATVHIEEPEFIEILQHHVLKANYVKSRNSLRSVMEKYVQNPRRKSES
jgi:hypothetical protein